MLFESVILLALFWPPPSFFFPLSVFDSSFTDWHNTCMWRPCKEPPIHSRTCRYHWSLSLSLSLSLCVCVLLGVGAHMWCIYDISPLPLSICFTIYGMIRMLSNDWGIATWQPRESLLRGWLARNVGWMILSWSNIILIGLYGLFQCLDSVNGKQSSSCRE